MKYNRNSKEYQLAERIVHLEEALTTANSILNKEGKLGVLPNGSVSFHEGKKFHKKVRVVLNERY